MSKRPLVDDDGVCRQLLGVAADVTDLKAAEAELLRARGRLIDAIESLDGGLVMFDADERLVLWNRQYAELYPGVADKLAAGAKYEDLLRRRRGTGGRSPASRSRRSSPAGWRSTARPGRRSSNRAAGSGSASATAARATGAWSASAPT